MSLGVHLRACSRDLFNHNIELIVDKTNQVMDFEVVLQKREGQITQIKKERKIQVLTLNVAYINKCVQQNNITPAIPGKTPEISTSMYKW